MRSSTFVAEDPQVQHVAQQVAPAPWRNIELRRVRGLARRVARELGRDDAPLLDEGPQRRPTPPVEEDRHVGRDEQPGDHRQSPRDVVRSGITSGLRAGAPAGAPIGAA